jgi:hypothetical protein
MQIYSQFLKLGPAMFFFMELLELMLGKFVHLDFKNDARKMRTESKIDQFDFIIGKFCIVFF